MRDDLRHALRSLGKAPGFALLAWLTLSSGLGFAIYCAAIFIGFSHGDIPFPQADRLVALETLHEGERTQANSIHYLDYQAYARAARSFESLQALSVATVTLGDNRHFPENFKAAYVPAAIWPWLGQKPEAGRLLEPGDEQAGAPPVAVIGAEVWRRFLGADPAVIGSRIKINGQDTTIVGVLPASLRFPMTQQVWLPFTPPAGTTLARANGTSMGTANHVMVLGRLKPEASRAQAQQELTLAAQQLATSFPKSNKIVGVVALSYSAWGMPDADGIYLGLMVAASLLLALVVINTGNLMLARANERRQEMAVRAALGAPRGRLIQQMLAEALILALAAALTGLFFSAWALDATQQAVLSSADGRLPFWINFRLSAPAAAFGLALTLLTALLTGWLPAWRASRVDVAAALRDGRGGTGRAAGRFSRTLVFVQIALSSLLLLVSGGQTYAVQQRLSAGTGARTEQVMTAQLKPRLPAYRGNPQAQAQLWARLESALRAYAEGAGGAGVVLGTSLPGGGMVSHDEVLPEGMQVQDGRYPAAGTYSVSAGYFKTLEVPLLAGREFNSGDRTDTLHVAVVNQNFAAQHWPGQDPLGKRFALAPAEGQAQRDWYTVVGVTRHLMQGSHSEESRRAANIYLPITQSVPDEIAIGLIGAPDNAASRELLARAVAQADPALALEKVYSADERQRIAYGGSEVRAALCLILGLMSMLLAVSGIYGVTSRAVALRTQEIGVRRAVGASDAAVLRLLLRQGLWQLLLGLPLGLLLGWVAMAQLAELGPELLLGVSGVAVLIGSVVMLATWLPARRAIALIPNAALHHD